MCLHVIQKQYVESLTLKFPLTILFYHMWLSFNIYLKKKTTTYW